MEVVKIDAAKLSLKEAIVLSDAVIDAFREDELYLALNLRYEHPHYRLVRLRYALVLLEKLRAPGVETWVALDRHDERNAGKSAVAGLCRWGGVPNVPNRIGRIEQWLITLAGFALDLFFRIWEPQSMRPLSEREISAYFARVHDYFEDKADLTDAAFLELIGIRWQYQHRGLGKQLMKESMASIRAPRYRLWAAEAGLGLYKSVGFTVKATHSSKLNGYNVTTMLMTM